MIIAFEGLDGSGKETQTKLLEKRLNDEGIKSIRFQFPSYGSKYSVFAEDYLNGTFKGDFNPYLISTFFSLERFGIYNSKIKKYIDEGYVLIFDRYVYSNLMYQGVFIEDLKERDNLFDFIMNFEYNICSLPKEDMVFYMDLSLEINMDIIKYRENKDIYEEDLSFLRKCYKNAKYIGDKYNFINIKCDNGKTMYPIKDINDSIYNIVLNRLGN